MLAYAQVKYLAALWMSALARRHPELRCVTVSPGNTVGTEASEEMPLRERILMRHVVPKIGPLLGIAHPLETGARRLVEGIADDRYAGGAFYASPGNGVTGPLVDQIGIRPNFADHTKTTPTPPSTASSTDTQLTVCAPGASTPTPIPKMLA